MKVIAAYLLAVLGGNAQPDASAINKILSSVGIEADSDKVNKLIEELKGKDIQEIIAQGASKLATIPAGGGAAAPAAAASAAPESKEAPKEEKKKEEPKEESDEVYMNLILKLIYSSRIWDSDYSTKRFIHKVENLHKMTIYLHEHNFGFCTILCLDLNTEER